MPKPKTPEFSEEKKCGHCGNRAPMLIVGRYSKVRTHLDDKAGFQWDAGTIYETLECPACGDIEFRSYYYHEGFEEQGVDYKTLYPTSTKIPIGLVDPIKKEYEAALKVKSVSANAYGVLMRRVLELVCEDRGASGQNLHQKLTDLAQKSEIPKQLVAVADSLRVFGNLGAHASLGELTENEVPILENLSRAILEYVYSAPYLVSQAEKALKQLNQRKRS